MKFVLLVVLFSTTVFAQFEDGFPVDLFNEEYTEEPATQLPIDTDAPTDAPATTAAPAPVTTAAPATTKAPSTTAVPATTRAPRTKKPTGSVTQCKKEFGKCLKRTSYRHRYRCVIKYKKCLWNLCPVHKCYDNARRCFHHAKSRKDKYRCVKRWKKCMADHRCPKSSFEF